MRWLLFVFLSLGAVSSIGRLKRQALPSNHVQVHSLDSNVSVSDVVIVTSSDSRIDLNEKKLNLSTWSTRSNVSFDTVDTFVNYTAANVETIARMKGVELHAQAVESEFSMLTSKTFEAAIQNSLSGRVNVSITDLDGMKIQAVEGKWADLNANTRMDDKTERAMSIYTNMSSNSTTERRLILSAVDRLYDIEAVMVGARVRTTYGEVILDIDPDYRTARIYTVAHTIELTTTLSPFGIEFNDERMLISAPFEETTAVVNRNSSDVHFVVGQLSQLRLARGGGQIELGGNAAQAERINVTSNNMSMDLFSTREMDARTNQSHISMITNTTTASLTSLFHHLRVTGGVPRMALYTGNITVNISTTPETPIVPTLFPGFSAPPDKFAQVGPREFPGNGGGNGVASRATIPPSEGGAASTEGGEGSVTVGGGTDGGVETERTVGYRTTNPSGTGGEGAETTVGEVAVTVNPVEGGNGGTEATTLLVSPDVSLPAGGEATTESPAVVVTTVGAEATAPSGGNEGQVTADATAGGNPGESSSQAVEAATITVPAEAEGTTSRGGEGGETTSGAGGEAATTFGGDGQGEGAVTVQGGWTTGGEGQAASTGGEAGTGAGEATTAAPDNGGIQTTTATDGGGVTEPSAVITTVITVESSPSVGGGEGGETSPADIQQPVTLGGETTTGGEGAVVTTIAPETGVNGDSTTTGVGGETRGPEGTTASIGGEATSDAGGVATPDAGSGGGATTPENGANGDATTVSPGAPVDQSTPGDGSLVTPPPLIPTDFVTPGTLIPDAGFTTDEFVIGQYSTDSIPDRSFGIFATISGVQMPDASLLPTPLVAEQQIEPDFPEPEALTSVEKRSPLSRTETFRVKLRMPRKVNTTDSSFTRELTRSVFEIANRTLEKTSAIADRRKRNIEIDPIILNVTDVSQVNENEAEVRFAVGLHSFDDIDHLIDALKRSIPNGSQNGVVIIERIEVYTSIEKDEPSWIMPVVLLIATAVILTLAFLAYKLFNASLLFKGLPACCERSPRIADSSSFRSFG